MPPGPGPHGRASFEVRSSGFAMEGLGREMSSRQLFDIQREAEAMQMVWLQAAPRGSAADSHGASRVARWLAMSTAVSAQRVGGPKKHVW